MAQSVNIASRIMVALDFSNRDAAEVLVKQLAGIPCYLKIGIELFYAAGPEFILQLKQQGYSIFLDLKLHDIPNTVKGAAASITRLGVDMFNVHASGGKQMMQAAAAGVQEGLESNPGLQKPIVIAVTQLTSTNRQVMNEEIGIPGEVADSVMRYAVLAKQSGLDGVVSSPWEVPALKAQLGSDFLTVTPGIRPAGSDSADQSRIMTPREAFKNGTDYIVIGRPITKHEHPRKALESIIEELM